MLLGTVCRAALSRLLRPGGFYREARPSFHHPATPWQGVIYLQNDRIGSHYHCQFLVTYVTVMFIGGEMT